MFTRKLKPDEQTLLSRMEALVKTTGEGPHGDPSQALEVVRLAVAIGTKVPEPANPVVVVAAALLHVLGAGVPNLRGPSRGFIGAALAEAFLMSSNLSNNERLQIVQAIGSAGAPTITPLESVEERILADAVELERLGMMGALRLVREWSGNLGEHIQAERPRRRTGFENLHFEASKELGRTIFKQGDVFLRTVEQAYRAYPLRLKEIPLPV